MQRAIIFTNPWIVYTGNKSDLLYRFYFEGLNLTLRGYLPAHKNDTLTAGNEVSGNEVYNKKLNYGRKKNELSL